MNTKTHPANVPSFERRHRMALALEHAGVTNEEMAEEIGRNATTVRNYLAGRTNPGRAILRVWALRTGVPYEWLDEGIIDLNGPDTPDDLGSSDSGCYAAILAFPHAA